MSSKGDVQERWQVIGHDWAVRALDHAVSSGKLAHALLLTGPHGAGKTTLARALARRLQCASRAAPCGECLSCVKIAKNISPDVRLVEGVPTGWKFDRDGPAAPPRANDRERRTLRIDQIRELGPWLATAPFESRYKIVILRRFEEAQEEAANAFLKTLEEPPSNVFLLLTAQDASLLLPTISSRTQRIALRPPATAQVERALIEKWQVNPAEARLLARVSGGRIGWAVRAASDRTVMETRAEGLASLRQLLAEGRAERLGRADELGHDTLALRGLLELWLTWWRDLLLLQSGDEGRVTNVDLPEALAAQAARWPTAEVETALQATRDALRQLEQNANGRLVMQVLALRLPG